MHAEREDVEPKSYKTLFQVGSFYQTLTAFFEIAYSYDSLIFVKCLNDIYFLTDIPVVDYF